MRWALSGVLCLSLGTSFAQDDAVVITASRSEQLLRESIPHTTVISRRHIRESQAVDLPALLRREAGVEFVQSGGIGRNSGTFLRGTATAQSLILIDGVRVADLGLGIASLDQIMLEEVERVEVVRGNVSSLYGSGAVGGVIQIFTRRGSGAPALTAAAAVGGEGDRRLGLGYGGEAGGTRFNVTVSGFQTEGFSVLRAETSPTVDPDRDGYRNGSFAASLSRRLAAGHEAGFSYYSTRGRQEYDSAIAFSPDDKQTADVRLGSLSAFLNSELTDAWLSKLRLSQATNANHDFLNGATSEIGSTKTRNRQFSWDNTVTLAPDHRLTGGVERIEQHIEATTVYLRDDRDIDALFAGYLGRIGLHSFQANARRERYSDFGDADSYLLGYALEVAPRWRLLASRGTGFRAPTFNDLFFAPIPIPPMFGGGFFVCNNELLRPEKARTGELGAQYASGTNLLKIVAFHTRVTDFIQPGCPPVNLKTATIDGLEASFSGDWLGTRINAAFTVQDPVQHTPTADLRLLRRAKRFGSFSASRALGHWRVGAEWLFSDERPDIIATSFSGARTELAGYGVVNATASYAAGTNTTIGVRLDNAFDKDYSLTHGFNTQGRKLTVSLSHTL
jgi:vitamin B12 transporter